jgi:hypothetical protein
MGSAFDCEPIPDELRGELVCFSFGWPDLVCHLPHDECPIEAPHRIEECGRFDRSEESTA